MARDKLTIANITALRRDPVKHAGKHFDGGGLYLLVTEQGGFYWRYKYRLGGKERLFSIGTLEDYSLAEARKAHDKARKHVLAGDDPVEERVAEKAAKEVVRAGRRPFREVAQEWVEMISPTKSAPTLRRDEKNIARMNTGFGDKDITTVTVADLAAVLTKIQNAGSYSMRERTQYLAVRLMGFAVAKGYLKMNPLRDISFNEGFIASSEVYKARPAITDAEPFGKLLRIIDRAPDEEPHCIIGLRILALIAVRPGELANARWDQIRWKEAKLVVPFAGQKMRTHRKLKKDPRVGKDFEVPLSKQALAELRRLQTITGNSEYLFPAFSIRRHKNPHMRATQFNNMLRRMGFENEHCGHGFRSSFSTTMNAERVQVGDRKVLRWPYQSAIIEVQLDHNDASTKAVYDRGGQWEDRCELMQVWADRIDEMRGARAAALRLVA
jgi:integrase